MLPCAICGQPRTEEPHQCIVTAPPPSDSLIATSVTPSLVDRESLVPTPSPAIPVSPPASTQWKIIVAVIALVLAFGILATAIATTLHADPAPLIVVQTATPYTYDTQPVPTILETSVPPTDVKASPKPDGTGKSGGNHPAATPTYPPFVVPSATSVPPTALPAPTDTPPPPPTVVPTATRAPY